MPVCRLSLQTGGKKRMCRDFEKKLAGKKIKNKSTLLHISVNHFLKKPLCVFGTKRTNQQDLRNSDGSMKCLLVEELLMDDNKDQK